MSKAQTTPAAKSKYTTNSETEDTSNTTAAAPTSDRTVSTRSTTKSVNNQKRTLKKDASQTAVETPDAHEEFFQRQAEIVKKSGKASLESATAILEIYEYGRRHSVWKDKGSFLEFCAEQFNYGKSHAHRLRRVGLFLRKLSQRNADPESEELPEPDNEYILRPILAQPREQWIEIWDDICAEAKDGKVTNSLVEKVCPRTKRGSAGKNNPSLGGKHQAALRKLLDFISGVADKNKDIEEAANLLRNILKLSPGQQEGDQAEGSERLDEARPSKPLPVLLVEGAE